MRAGDLDRRVTLQNPTTTRDSHGGVVETFADVATVWASYKPTRGREVFAGDVQIGEVEATFKIRWRADVDQQTRLVFEGAVYEILHAGELGRREGLELLTKIDRTP